MFPRMIRVRQRFPGPAVADVPAAVAAALAPLNLPSLLRPGASVAVTAGSRGIANIAAITRAVLDALKAAGARPFIFPSMGSHGGATAEGQVDVLRRYGITEETMGVPTRSTMETVRVGEALGIPVHLDRYAAEADHVVAINRVKAHTDFSAEIESGPIKMLAVGMGNHEGATLCHQANFAHGYEKVCLEVGRALLRTGKILFGLGIVENGYHQTAKVQALRPEAFEADEKALLRQAKAWAARLPSAEADVLIVETMGKSISGTGMDSKVIGRAHYIRPAPPPMPHIIRVVVCDLSEDSYGNAHGVGMADFITTRLARKIDPKMMAINSIASTLPELARIPLAFDTDREAIQAGLETAGLSDTERARMIRIRSTLDLAEVEMSEAYAATLRARPDLESLGPPHPMPFDAAGNLVPL
jgi:hypothetical protein